MLLGALDAAQTPSLSPRLIKGNVPETAQERRGRKAWEKGVLQAKGRKWLEAAQSYEQATRFCPNDSLYWINYGNVLAKLHRADDALKAARRAIACNEFNTMAVQLVAKLLRDRRQHQEALDQLRGVPAGAKLDAMHHVLIGACLSDLDKPAEAAQAFLDALALKPDSRDAHTQLGLNLVRIRQHGEAAECFRTALAIEPDALDAALYALHYAAWACDWDAVDRDKAALADCIDQLNDKTQATAISPFCLLSISDDGALLRSLSEWDMRRFDPLPQPMVHAARRRAPGERLRVGMVSSDFYHHATSMLLVQMLELMDKGRVELFLYSHGPDDKSALRERMVATADHFVECRNMSTIEQARVIRDDGVDVLLDLKGFTFDTRISVFSYRPAAVQVAWLGYPGTCGAPFIDYLIGDAVVTPTEHQPLYSERIAQLPHCYQPNDCTRGREADRTREEFGLPQDAVVFGSFNQSYKITREVFAVWCNILHRTPNSVLWMLIPDEPVRRRLLEQACQHGVAPDRLIFTGFERIDLHRRRIPLADIVLDTFPCGGHTTSSDVLWAGVPTVAMCGESFASRVAPSLLQSVGMPELICHDLQAYEDLSVELGLHPERITALKQRLIAARDTAPLYDSARLATDMVDLLERMWERASQGLAPDTLPAQRA
jgi:protein O-GlcNAc transferase